MTEAEGVTGAAIRLSNDGKFLYCSVRGENALYVFGIGNAGLQLIQKCASGGDSPRDFNIIEDKFLLCCNENSGNVIVFSLQNDKIGVKTCGLKLKKPLCAVT